MQEDVWARDDVGDGVVGRSRRADARQSPRRVDDARRLVVGPLDGGDQPVDEVDETIL